MRGYGKLVPRFIALVGVPDAAAAFAERPFYPVVHLLIPSKSILKTMKKITLLALCGAFCIGLWSCGQRNTAEQMPDYVLIHQAGEPQSLHPTNSRGAESTMMHNHLFQTLLQVDYKTLQLVPLLATARPVIRELPDGGMALDLEIRPEATWDDGTPITGHDVAFSVKVVKVPQVDNGHAKPYFTYIRAVEVDADEPRRFSILCERYFLAEQVLADLRILPAQVYDPAGALAAFSVADIVQAHPDSLSANAALQAFADTFNGAAFQREVVQGSGPYALASWQPQERLILKKKANWWGESVKDGHHWLRAYPDTLVFEIIPDAATALTALKAGRVNTMYAIDPVAFATDCQTPDFQSRFYTFEPDAMMYEYIGLNMASPLLSDVRTRRALAHLMNTPQLIETACNGFATQVASFSHPSRPERLSPNVAPYAFDVAKAAELLQAAGWADTDGDGWLDQVIDGQRERLQLRAITNQENKSRQLALQLLQEAGAQVGVQIEVKTPIWASFQEQLRDRGSYDLFVLGLGSSPFESDPSQVWHSGSIERGSNRMGYASPIVDAAIDSLRLVMDEAGRYPYYHRIHEEIHKDVPVIFLLTLRERIAVSRQFDNVYSSVMKPGFWAPGFTVAEREAM